MQAVRTTSRLGIDERCLQVVFPNKPIECTPCSSRPLFAAFGAPRRKARGNRRGRLDGLLIERFGMAAKLAEAFRANRPEASGRRGLNGHEPAQRSNAGLDVSRGVGRQARLNQSLRQTRVVVSENVFEPDPIVPLAGRKQRHQPVSQQLAHAVCEQVSRLQRAVRVQTQKREGPGAGR
jgi:hypothetical protein